MKKLILIGGVLLLGVLLSGCITSTQKSSTSESHLININELTTVTFEPNRISFIHDPTKSTYPTGKPTTPYLYVDETLSLKFNNNSQHTYVGGKLYTSTNLTNFEGIGAFTCGGVDSPPISNCKSISAYATFVNNQPFPLWVCLFPDFTPDFNSEQMSPQFQPENCKRFDVPFPKIDFEVVPNPITLTDYTTKMPPFGSPGYGADFTIKNNTNFMIDFLPNIILTNHNNQRIDQHISKDGNLTNNDYLITTMDMKQGFDPNDQKLYTIWKQGKNYNDENSLGNWLLKIQVGKEENPLYEQTIIVKKP